MFSGKLIVPQGIAGVHWGNDHLPQETINFPGK
jgi:hypothetical protein